MSVSPPGRKHKWTHRDLNPDFQSAELVSSPWTIGPKSVDRRGFEPAISGVRYRRPPVGRAALGFDRETLNQRGISRRQATIGTAARPVFTADR